MQACADHNANSAPHPVPLCGTTLSPVCGARDLNREILLPACGEKVPEGRMRGSRRELFALCSNLDLPGAHSDIETARWISSRPVHHVSVFESQLRFVPGALNRVADQFAF